MTKKYLQDIEKAYTKRAESLGGIPNNKGTVGYQNMDNSLIEKVQTSENIDKHKYKSMRDTTFVVGTWMADAIKKDPKTQNINSNIQIKKQHFLEHRMQRVVMQKPQKNDMIMYINSMGNNTSGN